MPSQPDRLTKRELEVLAMLARGHTRKKIAEETVLSPNTVQWHLKNIYAKVGARSKDEASGWYWANTTQNG